MLDSGCVTIYLNKDGHVNKIEGLECLKLNESEINNIHIKDLMDLLINKGITRSFYTPVRTRREYRTQ